MKAKTRIGCCLLTMGLSMGVMGSEEWVYDPSARPTETTSSAEASLAVLDTQVSGAAETAARAMDSRCWDSEVTSEIALITTKPIRGLLLIVR